MDIDDNAFKYIEAIIYSMTPDERSNPVILNGSRRQRIAKGSGTSIQEVNKLIAKQFDETRKMMRMLTSAKSGEDEATFDEALVQTLINRRQSIIWKKQHYQLLDGKAVSAQMKKEMA